MAHFAADRPLAAAARARASTTRRARRTSSRASWPAPSGPGEAYARFLHGRLFGPSAWRAPTPSSTRPAPGWPRPTSGPRHATAPASGCSTCATACGTASACCRRAGSTTAAPWSRSTTPRTPAPTARTGGAWRDTLDNLARGTFRASGYEGQTITICPAARPRRRAPGQDAARARGRRSSPWRAAMVRGLRRRPLSRPASAALGGRGDEDGDLAGPSSPGTRRRAGRPPPPAPTTAPSRRR